MVALNMLEKWDCVFKVLVPDQEKAHDQAQQHIQKPLVSSVNPFCLWALVIVLFLYTLVALFFQKLH